MDMNLKRKQVTIELQRNTGNTKQLPVARTGSRSRTCRSEMSLGSFSYMSCLESANQIIKITYTQILQEEEKAKHLNPAENFLDTKLYNHTCFPLSPSRWIRIFPIFIPLQHARNAFSILSPLQMVERTSSKHLWRHRKSVNDHKAHFYHQECSQHPKQ